MSSISMIESLAASLGALRERFVFVGGAVLELLITDQTVVDFRPTTDVDLLVEAATYGTYASVERTLTDQGFVHMVGPGVPICRWRIGEIVADIMPTEESVLGFGNRWYPEVVQTANLHDLPSGTTIRVTAAQYFIATKLEAFRTRGNADARTSYDMEDIIAVLDGRPGIEEEIAAASPAARSLIAAEFQQLSSDTDFHDAILGYLSVSPDFRTRRATVMARLAAITGKNPSGDHTAHP